MRRALWTGLSWGAGHAVTLGFIGGVLIVLRLAVPERVALFFELLVALMLILLGGAAVVSALRVRVHAHEHEHDGERHAHLHLHVVAHAPEGARAAGVPHRHPHPVRIMVRPFLVGTVHGLAGSAALVLLVLTTLPTVLLGLVYLGIFGAGSIAGMGLMSLALGAPLAVAERRAVWILRPIRAAAGIGSLALGVSLAVRIGTHLAGV
jgi:ABC-type nickel/cobalt efflux system permease component RcnA